RHATANVDAAVRAYLQAGVPASKLVVGVHFFGTGWDGVPDANHGLYQQNTGPAQGTWDQPEGVHNGNFGYQDLSDNYVGKYQQFYHPVALVPWLYPSAAAGRPGVMISYEDPQSLTAKVQYVQAGGLGGVMIWALSGDDAQYTLVNTLAA